MSSWTIKSNQFDSDNITNSTINSSTIGQTTPAAGGFTNITATGNIAVSGNVSVSGDGTFKNLTSTGNVVASAAAFSGAVNANNGLNVSGAASFKSLVSAENGLNVSGNVTISNIGGTLVIKQGANGKTGTVTVNGTTLVTASTNGITTNSGVLFTMKTPGGTIPTSPPNITSVVAGSQFVVKSAALDTSTYNYHIIESA